MFGIGAGELLVLMALALVIVGPQKLPEMGRTIGKGLSDFKSYTNEMRSVLTLDQTPIAATPAAVSKPLSSEDIVALMTRQSQPDSTQSPSPAEAVESVESVEAAPGKIDGAQDTSVPTTSKE